MAVHYAHYLDGQTAVRHTVELVFSDRGIQILSQNDHKILAFWDFEDIRPDATVSSDGETLRLTSRRADTARLTVKGKESCSLLRQRVKALHPKAIWRRRLIVGGLVVSTIPALIGLYAVLPFIAAFLAGFIPQEVEDKFGQAIMRTVVKTELGGRRCDEPGTPGYDALNGLVQRLAADSTLKSSFTLHVIDNKISNAFALPGGHIVVLSGLIDEAGSGDEVAGVLAHEMGHVVSRHTMVGLMRTLGVGAAILMITGDINSAVALGGVTLISLSYSRDDETEADMLAVRYLGNSGVSTQGLHDFFTRIAAQSKDSGSNFLRTHPDSEKRAALVGTSPSRRLALTDEEWQDVKKICQH